MQFARMAYMDAILASKGRISAYQSLKILN
jgi:hypothetical protein